MGLGGTDPSSILNQGLTSKNEMKAGSNGGADVEVTTVYPTQGYIPPPDKVAINTFMADWYRYGRISNAGDALEVQPKSLTEFDEKEAAIHVFAYDVKKKKDVELIPPYTKFILESVQEMHEDRAQIVETFGDFYVFFFGERPPMYQFSGTLINSKNANWVADFKFYYANYLRGTKCVENNARIILTYGGRQVEGFILKNSNATDATLEAGVKFSFPMVITRQSFIGFSDDFGFVTTSGGKTQVDKKYQELLNKIAGSEGAGLSQSKASKASEGTNKAMAGGPASSLSSILA